MQCHLEDRERANARPSARVKPPAGPCGRAGRAPALSAPWRRTLQTRGATLAIAGAAACALLAATILGSLAAITWFATLAAIAGSLIALLGAASVRRFSRAAPPPRHARPPVSLLRPLYGDEPGLDQALESLAAQHYPALQLIVGVQDPSDPALHAVARLRQRHPMLDLTVVANAATHGPNRKVSNLINMLPLARHDVLVFSDSDLHVPPDYLGRLVAALAQPGTGLVTALCTGLPTAPGMAARLGAMQITHSFLPGALLSRLLGRQDCLGTTMALRRETLARAGGLYGLAGHLADDNLLGQRVRRLGLRVSLATTVPATAVPETTVGMLWQHELRWARTIRALAPVAFAASALQFPIAWALLATLCSGGAAWTLGLAAATWAARAAAAAAVSRSLHCAPPSLLLLPVRDVLSVAQVAASFTGVQVMWRGHAMRVDAGRMTRAAPALAPSAALEPSVALEPSG